MDTVSNKYSIYNKFYKRKDCCSEIKKGFQQFQHAVNQVKQKQKMKNSLSSYTL